MSPNPFHAAARMPNVATLEKAADQKVRVEDGYASPTQLMAGNKIRENFMS